jgi:hypothetical protein
MTHPPHERRPESLLPAYRDGGPEAIKADVLARLARVECRLVRLEGEGVVRRLYRRLFGRAGR